MSSTLKVRFPPCSYEAVIVDAVRTPLGKRDGMLKSWHPVDLLGYTLNGLVQRNKLSHS